MAAKIASRMNRMAPSGIRKVNEKALAMERNGETVIHFEIGRPDFDTPEYIKKAAIESLNAGDVFGPSGEGYLRMSFANSYENIVEGCKRLGEAVAQLRK